MPAPIAKWRKLTFCVSRGNLGPTLSISCAVISLACLADGFYFLGAITAGANLIATRAAIRSWKKDYFAADRRRRW
jgi:hypothetical protein